MNRPARIALNTLAPPLIATLFFTGISFLRVALAPSLEPGDIGKLVKLFPTILFFAYLFASVPSFIHALVMERVYRSFPAHTGKAVIASTGSGVLAGILVDLVFILTSQRSTLDGWLLLYPTTGLIVGLTVGVIVKLLSEPPHPSKRSLLGCE